MYNDVMHEVRWFQMIWQDKRCMWEDADVDKRPDLSTQPVLTGSRQQAAGSSSSSKAASKQQQAAAAAAAAGGGTLLALSRDPLFTPKKTAKKPYYYTA